MSALLLSQNLTFLFSRYLNSKFRQDFSSPVFRSVPSLIFQFVFRESNSLSILVFHSAVQSAFYPPSCFKSKIWIFRGQFFYSKCFFKWQRTSGLWVVWGKKARTFRFSTNPSSHYFDLLFLVHKYIKCERQIRQNPSI